jgi:PPOX class probable F420-dependent enzyme
MRMPDGLDSLLRRPAICYLATTMPDGSPQLTQTWVDTDGEHILINTVPGLQKTRNVERDPRVAVAVSDPRDPARYFSVRGRVLSVGEGGAAEHLEMLSQRYTGGPYAWERGRDEPRVILTISVDRIHSVDA